jgi:hypothetical protein
VFLTSCGSNEVEHLSRHPKANGLSPATATNKGS